MGYFFSRFTEEARRALYFARIEAGHRGEAKISPRDLLLGLTWDENSRASQIALLKANAVLLRRAVEVPHLPSKNMPYKEGPDIPLDREAKKIIWLAIGEADRYREYWIDTDHLLRGMLSFPNQAAEAIKGIGVSMESVSTASHEHRVKLPPKPISKLKSFAFMLARKREISRPVGRILLFVLLTIALVLFLKWRGPI